MRLNSLSDCTARNPPLQIRRLALWVTVCLFLGPGIAFAAETPPAEPVVFSFASADEGKKVLTTNDEFVRRLSSFDRAARLQREGSISTEEYLAFVGGQTLNWEAEEKDRVQAAIESFQPVLRRVKWNPVSKVTLIKTTGREEGDAAYTRQTSIVLPQRMLRGRLPHLLAHELFHVASRHDPPWRDSLYALIGFRPCQEVVLPENFRPRRITNPDAPVIEHAIEVVVEGNKERVVPILFADPPKYDVSRGGRFFDYMQFRLLVVAPNGDAPAFQNGDLWLVQPDHVKGLIEQVGQGGDFIHPEEVLAGIFSELVNLPADGAVPPRLEKFREALLMP